jgi:hypothetical protein
MIPSSQMRLMARSSEEEKLEKILAGAIRAIDKVAAAESKTFQIKRKKPINSMDTMN